MLESPINSRENSCIYREAFSDIGYTLKNNFSISGTTYTYKGGVYSPNNDGANYITTNESLSNYTNFSVRIKGNLLSNSKLGIYQFDTAVKRISIGYFSDGYVYLLLCSGGVVNYGRVLYTYSDIKEMIFVYDGTASTNANKAKIYINGVQQTLTFSGTIPSKVETLSSKLVVGTFYPSNASDANYELVEIYNKSLDSNYISYLNNNSLYIKPQTPGITLLDYVSVNGIHEDLSGKCGFTQVGVTIDRNKQSYGAKFNGATTTKIDVSNLEIANKAFLYSCWFDNTSGQTLVTNSRLFNMGADDFVVYFNARDTLYLYRNVAGAQLLTGIKPGIHNLQFLFKSNGNVILCFDGVISTPSLSGAYTQVGKQATIGNRTTGSRQFTGFIHTTQIINVTAGITDDKAKEYMVQNYHSSKFLFQQ